MRVRAAVASDVDAMLGVKAAVPLRAAGARGGFLLGTSRERYEEHVRRDLVRVVEADGGSVVGFAVVWPDETLRQTPVWAARGRAGLPPALVAELERVRVCYFDQLAFLPGWPARRFAPTLALHALETALQTHQLCAATTVVSPLRNSAALPLLARAGFVPVGQLDERYEGVGEIRSQVHLLDARVGRTPATLAPPALVARVRAR